MLPVIALSLFVLASQGTAAPSPTESPAVKQQSSPAAPSPPQQAYPNPDASGRYHAGDGVAPPSLIHTVNPEYSKEAKKRHISGVTTVSVTVDADGNPSNVHVLRSMADEMDKENQAVARSLDQKAVDAVKHYRFAPAMFQGKPVAVEINLGAC
jgi:TonB family protein